MNMCWIKHLHIFGSTLKLCPDTQMNALYFDLLFYCFNDVKHKKCQLDRTLLETIQCFDCC